MSDTVTLAVVNEGGKRVVGVKVVVEEVCERGEIVEVGR